MPEHGARDWEYIHLVARHLAGAISSASRLMRPAKIGFGRGEHVALAWNRTYEGGPVDPSLLMMRVDDEATERPLAILVNYACHPVMLGPKSTISAGYPGPARHYVDAAFPGCTSMYANGPCGDIDPVSNKEVWGQATFEDVDRAAKLLADNAIAVARGIETTPEWRIGVKRAAGCLPYQRMTLAEAEAEVERWEAELERGSEEGMGIRSLNHVRWQLKWSQGLVDAFQRGTMPSERTFELQAITLGDTAAVVALPGEIFTEVGQEIRARSVYPFTLLASCANDNVGYVATELDFERQGYGSSRSFVSYGQLPFTTDVGQRFVELVAPLVEA
jgi:neutral ceramidase